MTTIDDKFVNTFPDIRPLVSRLRKALAEIEDNQKTVWRYIRGERKSNRLVHGSW